MSDPARSPGQGPPRPAPAAGSHPCPSCGWANPPAATRCDFCKLPFERPKPGAPATITCPHCGAENPRKPGEHLCPGCGKSYHEKPSAAAQIKAQVAEATEGFHISPYVLIFSLIVGMGMVGFCVQFSAQKKAATADHIRNIKKMLEIYEGENGGYPKGLAQLERRMGPIAPFYRNDGWGTAIEYAASRPRGQNEAFEPIFLECELRSAGPNGKMGDDDDMVWKGTAR